MARTQLKPAASPPAQATPAEPKPVPKPVAANNGTAPAGAAGVPPITTENPWRNLHPVRVWPD